MFQFLRLSAKFLAVLRQSVNPIETLISGQDIIKAPLDECYPEPKTLRGGLFFPC